MDFLIETEGGTKGETIKEHRRAFERFDEFVKKDKEVALKAWSWRDNRYQTLAYHSPNPSIRIRIG